VSDSVSYPSWYEVYPPTYHKLWYLQPTHLWVHLQVKRTRVSQLAEYFWVLSSVFMGFEKAFRLDCFYLCMITPLSSGVSYRICISLLVVVH